MRSRRSSRRCGAEGFSFVELLVTLGLSGIVLAGMTTFFTQHARRMRVHTTRVEVQQALRASLDAITRDVRLAGACLPQNGQFIALDGTDGTTDSITIRAGVVRNDLSCLFTATTSFLSIGATAIPVEDADGFAAGQLVYMRDPNGSGELKTVSAVNAAGPTVTLTSGISQQYPVGSGVYAVDERTYSVDKAVTPPVLQLQVNRGTPQAFAAGITDLQFLYVLDQNCPPCDVVSLNPVLGTDEWWTVNEVLVTATAETIDAARSGETFELTQVSRSKPRNLLP
jgi:Tfp pilus assembly protein PilW